MSPLKRGAGRAADLPEVAVADTERALWKLAEAARKRIRGHVVGITGSVGKTTTKDMLESIIGVDHSVFASMASFNNHIGVPLTLLGASGDEWAVVVEMGASAPGEIAALAALARPSVGVVTSVGAAHTEFFGSIDGVARAKRELVEALPEDGMAVLNADDDYVAEFWGYTRANVLNYGIRYGEIVAEDIEITDGLRAAFRLITPWNDTKVRLAVPGRHNVYNALAAAAAAYSLRISFGEILAGLERAQMSAWRMALLRTPAGAVVINDAYNANPVSTEAALRALAALPARRKVAVLGVMAELGERHGIEHLSMGVIAESLGIEVLAVDEPAYRAKEVRGIEGALAELGELMEGDAVLVKGSRVAGLERLANALAEGATS